MDINNVRAFLSGIGVVIASPLLQVNQNPSRDVL